MSPEGTTRRSAKPEASTGGLGAVRIAKAYRGRQVVKDVSLFLRRGEVVGLLGPNGAGKTTCFYMITGLVRVDQGQILLDGQDVTTLPMYQRARQRGLSPTRAVIFRGLTVEQNVMSVVELSERSHSKRREDRERSARRVARRPLEKMRLPPPSRAATAPG
ncbi:MAG: ATP-binding cassette domain-containing protein [Hyphomonadaceae bacterium]